MSDKTSLIVDDDPLVRRFIKAVLERDGYQVTEAKDGLDALDTLRTLSGAVDVLVSDIKMPHLDGLALAGFVRAEFPAIAILLISGYGALERKPAFDILQKPFLPSALVSAVNQIVHPRAKVASAQ